jgi:hypothetical protein
MSALGSILLLALGITTIAAQTPSQEPPRVTLEARRQTASGDNYVHAVFSFEHNTNGLSGKQRTRNDWDILFGNYPDRDTFDVTTVTDDCSRIVDLGARTWSDGLGIPQLPAHPVPMREPSVDAVVGHMYLVHTKDRDSDFYALFRVEELQPRQRVTISWRRLP